MQLRQTKIALRVVHAMDIQCEVGLRIVRDEQMNQSIQWVDVLW